jgi:hypothetical protein
MRDCVWHQQRTDGSQRLRQGHGRFDRHGAHRIPAGCARSHLLRTLPEDQTCDRMRHRSPRFGLVEPSVDDHTAHEILTERDVVVSIESLSVDT